MTFDFVRNETQDGFIVGIKLYWKENIKWRVSALKAVICMCYFSFIIFTVYNKTLLVKDYFESLRSRLCI